MPSGLGTPGLPRAHLEPHRFSARALLGVSDSARDSTIKTRTPRVRLVIRKNVTSREPALPGSAWERSWGLGGSHCRRRGPVTTRRLPAALPASQNGRRRRDTR